MARTLADIDARIAELEAAMADVADLPEQGTVGGTSYSMGAGRLRDLRAELDRWVRLRRTHLNGGVALATRRGCG